ncbi:MAG: MFS transporter, partial [Dehalococcoidia bacterium]|nr:MFS transporter [Dehalococcoidia bacterium]
SLIMVQLYVDDKVRGRVTSVFTMFVGLMPIAGLMAGAAANALGIEMAVMLAGLWVFGASVAVSIGFRVLYQPVEASQKG